MSQRILSGVSTTPVAVTAGASGYQVSINPVPGASTAFLAYDANQNLLATIPVNGTYQWTAPQTGDPFFAGQIVGYVAVPAGTVNFIMNDSNVVLYATPQSGGAFPAAGAITQKNGRAFLTGATAQAYTLAAPIPGADDFKLLEIVNQSGQAHTVTTGTNGFNGADHVATYGATVGIVLALRAYQGVWYVGSATGNGITLS
jgi:hypothetical protein